MKNLDKNKKLLYRGAKSKINGDIDVNYGRKTMILVKGFMLEKAMSSLFLLFLILSLLQYFS